VVHGHEQQAAASSNRNRSSSSSSQQASRVVAQHASGHVGHSRCEMRVASSEQPMDHEPAAWPPRDQRRRARLQIGCVCCVPSAPLVEPPQAQATDDHRPQTTSISSDHHQPPCTTEARKPSGLLAASSATCVYVLCVTAWHPVRRLHYWLLQVVQLR
jgi:hypothetical protein